MIFDTTKVKGLIYFVLVAERFHKRLTYHLKKFHKNPFIYMKGVQFMQRCFITYHYENQVLREICVYPK